VVPLFCAKNLKKEVCDAHGSLRCIGDVGSGGVRGMCGGSEGRLHAHHRSNPDSHSNTYADLDTDTDSYAYGGSNSDCNLYFNSKESAGSFSNPYFVAPAPLNL